MTNPVQARNAVEAWRRYYYLYGTAMAAWAGIEKELATTFVLISGIQPDVAMQIMFSVKAGFNARKDIFRERLRLQRLMLTQRKSELCAEVGDGMKG